MDKTAGRIASDRKRLTPAGIRQPFDHNGVVEAEAPVVIEVAAEPRIDDVVDKSGAGLRDVTRPASDCVMQWARGIFRGAHRVKLVTGGIEDVPMRQHLEKAKGEHYRPITAFFLNGFRGDVFGCANATEGDAARIKTQFCASAGVAATDIEMSRNVTA